MTESGNLEMVDVEQKVIAGKSGHFTMQKRSQIHAHISAHGMTVREGADFGRCRDDTRNTP